VLRTRTIPKKTLRSNSCNTAHELAARNVSKSGFRARAGTLTLLYVASSTDREVLLQMLADAMLGGLLRDDGGDAGLELPESVELPGVEIADYGDEEAIAPELGGIDVPEIVLESGEVVSPDTPMRITPEGEEILFTAFTAERWLRNSPTGPLELGEEGAGQALASLVCNWSGTVIHGLSQGPLTLPELSHAVVPLSYPVLEEHVDAMERTGQVEARRDGLGRTRYWLTDWLREGIAPLAAAARLERHYPSGDTMPPDALDIGAAFRLTLPLLRLSGRLSGSCRFGVKLSGGGVAGVTAQIGRGRVLSCEQRLDEGADAWASGSAVDWLDTLVAPEVARVDVRGERHLADAVIAGLHETLFGIPVR
jgi:DNA-binding HxlR family transcriptional regulator